MKIDFGELSYDYEKGLDLYKGLPFSGIAFENSEDGSCGEIAMINGVKNGISRKWYASGILKEETHIENNYFHGVSWHWSETGKLVQEATYEYGILTKEKKWNHLGDIIHSYDIDENSPNFQLLCSYRKTRRTNFFSVPDAPAGTTAN